MRVTLIFHDAMFLRTLSIAVLAVCLLAPIEAQEKAKVVFISGSPSHGRMQHEHRAGNMILASALNKSGLDVEAVLVPHYGYPDNATILEGAATIVIFSRDIAGMLSNHVWMSLMR